MKEIITEPNKFSITAITLISLAILFFIKPAIPENNALMQGGIFEGNVVEIRDEYERRTDDGRVMPVQVLRVEVVKGDEKEEIEIVNDYVPASVGDVLYLQESLFDMRTKDAYAINNIKRDVELKWILALFIVLVVLISGLHGVRSLVGLLFSGAVILKLMIPALFFGTQPILVGIGGALLILLVSLYVTYGLNIKSLSAFLGIGITLVLVAGLTLWAASSMRLTGYSEEAFYVNLVTRNAINFASLLVAGILIAVIGILDDVAMTQVSTVFTLASETNLRGRSLFYKAMIVGHDHIAAVINTLFLAYAGAGLPLLLLFSLSEMPVAFLISNEIIAEEIVRTLVASIGLVMAIPITTLIAVFFVMRLKRT
jgi:uncharacterized membrane protein